jgi:hypothetical protein
MSTYEIIERRGTKKINLSAEQKCPKTLPFRLKKATLDGVMEIIRPKHKFFS